MSIVYEATCAECGTELTVTSVELDSSYDLCIKLAPCEECLEAAKSEGHEEGRELGYQQAKDEE